MLNIVNLIPYGKANAISRVSLRNITGLSDRNVRHLIAEARTDTIILTVDNGKGYFRPTKDELEEIQVWLKKETARANSTFKSIESAREILKGGNIYEIR